MLAEILSDETLDMLLGYLFIGGSIGTALLFVFSLRFRTFLKERISNIGVILLDTFMLVKLFLTVILGMVSYTRYTHHRFDAFTWFVIIILWVLSIWAGVVRIGWWYLRSPNPPAVTGKEIENDSGA
jgi:hypothetical protein